jgi:hypothetical protein
MTTRRETVRRRERRLAPPRRATGVVGAERRSGDAGAGEPQWALESDASGGRRWKRRLSRLTTCRMPGSSDRYNTRACRTRPRRDRHSPACRPGARARRDRRRSSCRRQKRAASAQARCLSRADSGAASAPYVETRAALYRIPRPRQAHPPARPIWPSLGFSRTRGRPASMHRSGTDTRACQRVPFIASPPSFAKSGRKSLTQINLWFFPC